MPHAETSERAAAPSPPAEPAAPSSPAEPAAPSAAAEARSPWRAGLATGIGSLPGVDPSEAAALIAGELPDLPHLAELPGRGAGADMIGRALAICVDLPAEVVPSGWRLARRPGRDIRRANDFLAWDVDAAEASYAGAPWVKVQVAGPWTLAANVETPNGHRALLDPGATRDLAESLTEGLKDHLADLARRLPGTGIVVQVDEPSLPAVLAGSLSTASGFGRVPAVAAPDAQQVLSELVASLTDHPTVAHCCHTDAPLNLLRGAGFGAVSMDLTVGAALPGRALDAIGESVEAGTVLLAGLVPTRPPTTNESDAGDIDNGQSGELTYRSAAAPLLDIWHRLGLPTEGFAGVAVTPVCGLAAATPAWTRRALRLARETGRFLADRSAE